MTGTDKEKDEKPAENGQEAHASKDDGEETPDAASFNGDTSDEDASAATEAATEAAGEEEEESAPEVDVEVLAPPEDADAEDRRAGEPDPADADTHETPTQQTGEKDDDAAPRRRRLTPGLALLSVFTVFALGLFIADLAFRGNSEPGQTRLPQTAAPRSETARATTKNNEAQNESNAPIVLDLPSAQTERDPPAAAKIRNRSASAAKMATAALPDDMETPEGAISELPPAPDADAFGNSGLQSAAKDALALLQPSEEEGQETIEEETGQDADTDGFDDAGAFDEDAADGVGFYGEEGDETDETTDTENFAEKQDDRTPDQRAADQRAADQRAPDQRAADATAPVAPLPDQPLTDPRVLEEMRALRAAFEQQAADLADALAAERERADRAERETEEIVSRQSDFQDALTAQLERTTARIEALQAQLEDARAEAAAQARAEAETGPSRQAAAAALALAGLSRTLETGAPYERELSVLADIAPGAPMIAALEENASTGAPTLGSLKTRFDAFARRAMAAARREDASGFAASLRANIGEYINIRPAAPTEGDAPPAVISRAEGSLYEDDLAACLDHLGELQGAAAAAFDPWTREARARLETARAIEALNGALLNALGE